MSVLSKLTSSFVAIFNEKFAGQLFARFIVKGEARLTRADAIRDRDAAEKSVIMLF